MSIRQKNNFSIFIFLMLFILIFFFVISPTLKDIKSMAKELDSQENKLIVLQLKADGLEQFKNIYNDLEGDFKKIDDLFVDSKVPIGFIDLIENEAQQLNLDFGISSVSIQNSKIDPWPCIIFQVTADGSFSDLLKFLEKIENSFYLTEIRTVNIREAENGLIQSSISMKVFAK